MDGCVARSRPIVRLGTRENRVSCGRTRLDLSQPESWVSGSWRKTDSLEAASYQDSSHRGNATYAVESCCSIQSWRLKTSQRLWRLSKMYQDLRIPNSKLIWQLIQLFCRGWFKSVSWIIIGERGARNKSCKVSVPGITEVNISHAQPLLTW